MVNHMIGESAGISALALMKLNVARKSMWERKFPV